MSGPIFLVLRILLAVSLYTFLAWAFVMLWRDVKQQGMLLATRRVPPLTIMLEREDLAPQMRHFSHAEITIGRDPACECPVSDDAISARHARLSHHHGQWWLEDLGSTNGTLLNRESLSTPTVVISNDTITCGKTQLTVMMAGDNLMPPTRRIEPRKEKP